MSARVGRLERKGAGESEERAVQFNIKGSNPDNMGR
jgi:hypothetical protein